MYVPNILVIGEICYQVIMQVFNATLVKDKNRLFIPYKFQIGYYVFNDTNHAKKEGQVHLEYKFMVGRYRNHDPKGLAPKHVEKVVFTWPYAHENWEEEMFTENSQDRKEVESRREKPNITMFFSLPIEEKIKMVNLGVSSIKGVIKEKCGGAHNKEGSKIPTRRKREIPKGVSPREKTPRGTMKQI
jgi:hypothetical protein